MDVSGWSIELRAVVYFVFCLTALSKEVQWTRVAFLPSLLHKQEKK